MTDPLNINVPIKDTDTAIPLAPEGDYECQITASAIEPNKDKTGHNWNLELQAIDPIDTIGGRSVSNMKFFVNNIALQPKEDSKDPEAFRRGIASAVDAIYGTSKGNRPDFNRAAVEGAVGKRVLANVIIDEYQGNKNNKVRRLKKVTA